MQKRLFFGLQVQALWPKSFPKGRIIEPKDRHFTLSFLGETDYKSLKEILTDLPNPLIHPIGIFSKCLFLPEKNPRVVAWKGKWTKESEPIIDYQQTLSKFLKKNGFSPIKHKEPWLPHVTLARNPQNLDEWKDSFIETPFTTTGLHLYESLGNSKYQIIWSLP